jgi:hypothetical protein
MRIDDDNNIRVGEEEDEGNTSSKGSMEEAPQPKRVTVRKRRHGEGELKGLSRHHENSLLECEGVGGKKKKTSTEGIG